VIPGLLLGYVIGYWSGRIAEMAVPMEPGSGWRQMLWPFRDAWRFVRAVCEVVFR